jgi:hypothetical protein
MIPAHHALEGTVNRPIVILVTLLTKHSFSFVLDFMNS